MLYFYILTFCAYLCVSVCLDLLSDKGTDCSTPVVITSLSGKKHSNADRNTACNTVLNHAAHTLTLNIFVHRYMHTCKHIFLSLFFQVLHACISTRRLSLLCLFSRLFPNSAPLSLQWADPSGVESEDDSCADLRFDLAECSRQPRRSVPWAGAFKNHLCHRWTYCTSVSAWGMIIWEMIYTQLQKCWCQRCI